MGLVTLPLRATEFGRTQAAARSLSPPSPQWLVVSVLLGAMLPASLVTIKQHLKPALIVIALIPSKANCFPRVCEHTSSPQVRSMLKCVAYLSIES